MTLYIMTKSLEIWCRHLVVNSSNEEITQNRCVWSFPIQSTNWVKSNNMNEWWLQEANRNKIQLISVSTTTDFALTVFPSIQKNEQEIVKKNSKEILWRDWVCNMFWTLPSVLWKEFHAFFHTFDYAGEKQENWPLPDEMGRRYS